MNKFGYKIRLLFALFVLVMTFLGFFGIFYPVEFLNYQFVPLINKIVFDKSLLAVCYIFGIFLLTLLFGRFYCSTLCPFGILQEVFSIFRFGKENTKMGNYGFKYLISALVFGCLFGGSAVLIRHMEPFSIFGSISNLSLFGLIFGVCVLILILFKNRFFCINICPVGAILGLISKFSVNKIYIDETNCIGCGSCLKSCPSGCINRDERTVDNEICIRCLKCFSTCPGNAYKFGVKPQKFSLGRRKFVWGLGALAFIGAGYTLGLNLIKNTAKKFKNIILPPGARNQNSFENRCLNCNLCINMCPNGILVKADENFPTVHIDYSQGKKYCEFNCNNCSYICPTGAIKKLSLEQKQKTKIAVASVYIEKCTGCQKCSSVCPTGAITLEMPEENPNHMLNRPYAVVDASKCIGCGRCQQTCFHKSIDMFAAEEQTVI